jgi:hypothetical protein
VRHRPLLYIETSVFGFYFDRVPHNALRREAVMTLMNQVQTGILDAFTSPLTFSELSRTGGARRDELLALLTEVRTLSLDDSEIDALTEAYLRDDVIPLDFAEDAVHVAYATLGRADVLVSLNLRHLANEWAERRIAAVNLREGYQALRIRTPEEVLTYED